MTRQESLARRRAKAQRVAHRRLLVLLTAVLLLTILAAYLLVTL